LEQSGFVVRSVSDGYSAIAELRTNPYDLIVMDISMPHMNGFTLLKTLRSEEKFKTLPAMVLTASNDKDSLSKFQDYDINDYILKPPQREDLIARVERVLGGRPQFEEVIFNEKDLSAHGFFLVPVAMKSISKNGIVMTSPLSVEKKYILNSLSLGVFKDLNIKMNKFTVTECVKKDAGYEYFISFLGMPAQDQEKILQFIMSKTFEKKIAL
jgi:CheY-like chemotaxis protein